MDVTIKARTGFAHGKLNLKRGDEATVTEAVAKDLDKAGLVEINAATPAGAGDTVGTAQESVQASAGKPAQPAKKK